MTLPNKRNQFAQTKADYQSGRSFSLDSSASMASASASSSSSIGSIESDKGGAVPSNSLKRPPHPTPNSSARSLKSGSERQKWRPALERKLSSRGQLAASDRQFSTTVEVMTTDSREACIKRQLAKSRRNLLMRGAVSARCLSHPAEVSSRGRLTASNRQLSMATEDMNDSHANNVAKIQSKSTPTTTARNKSAVRPSLERKLSSRGRLTASNRQLSTTTEDMKSVMTSVSYAKNVAKIQSKRTPTTTTRNKSAVRPLLERKLSSRGRLTASNRQLSTATEDMKSIMTFDSFDKHAANIQSKSTPTTTTTTTKNKSAVRPSLERKLSSRGRLTASNRQLSMAAEDMKSLMTVDSAEASNQRQLSKSRRNVLTRGVASTRCSAQPTQGSNNRPTSASSS